MKLDKSHFRKKMRFPGWNQRVWLIPLAQKSNGDFIGESNTHHTESYEPNLTDWEFYEEPKKPVRVESAKAVIRDNDGTIFISSSEFGSEGQARMAWGNKVLAWPAPFDPVRGIWYYEDKE